MSEIELTAEHFFSDAAKALPIEKVYVPALGGFSYVRGMSGKGRGSWEQSLVRRGKVDARNARASLAARCLVNHDGKRLFNDEQADALGDIRVDILQPIFEVAQRLSGVSDKDIDELGKSSAAAGSNDSSSD
jgi:hypothetical protein